MDKSNPSTVVDVAIVGAGLAGLTAAALLARTGHSVLLMDRRDPGGRARSVEHEQFTLNDGPHALYNGGQALATLRSLGIDVTGASPELGQAGTWVNGAVQPLPSSPLSMLRSKVLSARSKLVAARILPKMMKGHAKTADGKTLVDWFDHHQLPNDLRAMIEMYVRLTTYCNMPDQMAAPAAISQFALAQQGVTYLDGGWQQLVDALLRVVEQHGGVVSVGPRVEGLTVDGDKWIVATEESAVPVAASCVVLAAGGPLAASQLVGEDPGWVEAAGPQSRAACLDLGVDSEPSVPVLLAMNSPLYGSTHAPPAELAPEGRGLVGVMRYLAPDETLDRDQARRELLQHADRMGIAEGEIVMQRYLHSMTVAYGSPLADRRRPRGDELANRKLWVAGDWVDSSRAGEPVPFLADAAVGSAVLAATQIAERLEHCR